MTKDVKDGAVLDERFPGAVEVEAQQSASLKCLTSAAASGCAGSDWSEIVRRYKVSARAGSRIVKRAHVATSVAVDTRLPRYEPAACTSEYVSMSFSPRAR